jgi:hypothetical protein
MRTVFSLLALAAAVTIHAQIRYESGISSILAAIGFHA